MSWCQLSEIASNATYIYGYVATVCLLQNDTGDILMLNVTNAPTTNTSSSHLSTVVSGLRPYKEYEVKVVAVVRDRLTGVIFSKSSPTHEFQTLESGE